MTRTTQAIRGAEFPTFSQPDEWFPSSLHPSPMDFFANDKLESRIGERDRHSRSTLRRAIARAWNRLSIKVVRDFVDSVPGRIRLGIKGLTDKCGFEE